MGVAGEFRSKVDDVVSTYITDESGVRTRRHG